ncbi:hypothetical protein [Amphibacillus marinus]|nr:hypothetical protein [Amphibacillus marinus]
MTSSGSQDVNQLGVVTSVFGGTSNRTVPAPERDWFSLTSPTV